MVVVCCLGVVWGWKDGMWSSVGWNFGTVFFMRFIYFKNHSKHPFLGLSRDDILPCGDQTNQESRSWHG